MILIDSTTSLAHCTMNMIQLIFAILFLSFVLIYSISLPGVNILPVRKLFVNLSKRFSGPSKESNETNISGTKIVIRPHIIVVIGSKGRTGRLIVEHLAKEEGVLVRPSNHEVPLFLPFMFYCSSDLII